MQQPMLIAENIRYSYPRSQTQVFGEGVSMTAHTGEITAIVGKSGTGKSTLLACLAGVLTPQGRILLDGVDTLERKQKNINTSELRAIVLQNSAMFEKLTIWQNIAVGWGYPGKSAKQRAVAHLQILGMEEFADTLPSKLSLGQRQRAAIAAATAQNPKVLFADEPTGSLDSENTSAVASVLAAVASQGSAVIIATHDEQLVKQANRVFEISTIGGLHEK